MEQIWDYLFYQKMQIDPEIWQLATAEPLLSPMAQVEAKAQIFFEKYKFPSLCVTDEGTQTMLSKGYSSCICVCIGDGTTTISAVSDSFRIPSATQKLEIGGRDVTMFLQSLLCNNGYSFVTPGELEILREIKEKHCYALEVPLSGQAADTRVSYREESLISLPGGDVIPMTSEKWKCAEVLFDPSLAGLPQRLLQEMKKINTYPGCVPQVKFTPDDNSSNWIGLSIVGSLYDSEDRWVSEAEYEEFGTDLCTEQTC
ncbi:actin, alpha cardiac muscle 1-like isoform X2 [Pecten maximus]|uniref:actin, alpha cardiac muscle 1-like isoform X2 n=1 Tax=Pecten maximus TaxID=6579 RepID=UPI001457E951|nr:actin, alpha cardiac muscle 1-like isoform X2 [Pecten maximus]